jgi:effector-binding domain-containing protein
MFEPPQIIETPAEHTAVIRLTVPREKIRDVMGSGLRELMAAIASQGILSTGSWFTHHLKMDPEIFDLEISVPVATPVQAMGRVQPSEWPAMKVARTIYRGPYEGLGEAWGELEDWIVAQGHAPASNLRECYVAGPETGADTTKWRTELIWPLRSKG